MGYMFRLLLIHLQALKESHSALDYLANWICIL